MPYTRPGLQKKNIILNQKMEMILAMEKVRHLKYKLLDHARYLPGLTPFNFRPIPNIGKSLIGKLFGSSEWVVERYFPDLTESYLRSSVEIRVLSHFLLSLFITPLFDLLIPIHQPHFKPHLRDSCSEVEECGKEGE